ncbi:hypothetical protein GDO86_006269 [Hymenochirus boettgeri]|uniref:Uncharacterized protein n=1 Tax=Hymenochirus boettgeri TaxID=247094 RepID=A0A8T2JCY5_9PIPI|nr:hypothetical protein GDO86_006269 [Hymenochirus boettgeri]
MNRDEKHYSGTWIFRPLYFTSFNECSKYPFTLKLNIFESEWTINKTVFMPFVIAAKGRQAVSLINVYLSCPDDKLNFAALPSFVFVSLQRNYFLTIFYLFCM